MTLSEITRLIEMVASHQPSVNMIVRNDIFRLNGKSDAKYGVFAWVQGRHSSSIDSSMISFEFTLYYVDRLTHDLSNQIEVQSVGITTLDNVLGQLSELGVYVDSYTFQTFNQRFFDECSGVFTNVTLNVPKNAVCGESYADYNLDYNNDFYVY